MTAQPLLPPRGIFIPTHMIFNTQLPPAVLVTWIQLRCLAWAGWSTPPLSISELASLIGIHPNRLHKHLSHLQEISALAWRITKVGKLILSFPEEPPIKPEQKSAQQNNPLTSVHNFESSATADPASYFPYQIMGYLSYPEESEVFSTLEVGEALKVEQVNEVADFEHC